MAFSYSCWYLDTVVMYRVIICFSALCLLLDKLVTLDTVDLTVAMVFWVM